VGVYIKHGVPYTRRLDLERDDLEIIWFEIKFKNAKKFILGFLYRPPDSSRHVNNNFVKSMQEILTTIDLENLECTLMGDINCDYLKDNDHRDIKTLFVTHGYKQLVKNATRITDISETLIDVVLSNTPETIKKCKNIISSVSDHDIIAMVRKKASPKFSPKTITSRNYKNYNKETIKNELKSADWETVMNCHDSNRCWGLIKNILTKCIDTHAPFTKKTIKGKPCPWLTESIKKQMNDRDKILRKARSSKNENDWTEYKNMKNRVNNLIKSAKSKHNKKLLNENISKPEKFWRQIKSLYPTNKRKK